MMLTLSHSYPAASFSTQGISSSSPVMAGRPRWSPITRSPPLHLPAAPRSAMTTAPARSSIPPAPITATSPPTATELPKDAFASRPSPRDSTTPVHPSTSSWVKRWTLPDPEPDPGAPTHTSSPSKPITEPNRARGSMLKDTNVAPWLQPPLSVSKVYVRTAPEPVP